MCINCTRDWYNWQYIGALTVPNKGYIRHGSYGGVLGGEREVSVYNNYVFIENQIRETSIEEN